MDMITVGKSRSRQACNCGAEISITHPEGSQSRQIAPVHALECSEELQGTLNFRIRAATCTHAFCHIEPLEDQRMKMNRSGTVFWTTTDNLEDWLRKHARTSRSHTFNW
jgi:hypothetical protein